MKTTFFVTAATGMFLGAMIEADDTKKEIVGLKPEQVRWSTAPYYTDGRQRAQMLGDSSQGGAWVDRVKIPAGAVFLHTRIRMTKSLRSSKGLVSRRGNQI